jgi:hypothetical protein
VPAIREQVERYVRAYAALRSRSMKASPPEANSAWNSAFLRTTRDAYLLEPYSDSRERISALPEILALVHPDFFQSRAGDIIKALLVPPWVPGPAWRCSPPSLQRCESGRIFGYTCPFEDGPERTNDLQADHVWPRSLGGPAIPENRVWLCGFHNRMKGYDIYHFEWNVFPSWLAGLVKSLAALKD